MHVIREVCYYHASPESSLCILGGYGCDYTGSSVLMVIPEIQSGFIKNQATDLLSMLKPSAGQ